MGFIYFRYGKRISMNIKNLNKQYNIFLIFLIFLYLSPVFAHESIQIYQNKTDISLSDKETSYLQSHPVLRVQSENDYPPFNFIQNGKPIGYSVDYVDLLSNILNIKIDFVAGKSWDQYLAMLKRNELDFMVNIIRSDERDKFAIFSQPYTEITNFIITRDLSDEEFLLKKGTPKRIAIGKGYAINEDLFKKYPGAEFIKVSTPYEALTSVLYNEADVYFESGAVAGFYMDKNFLKGLKINPINRHVNISNNPLRLATNKNNPILLSILKKAMITISEDELIKLRSKWSINSPQNILSLLNKQEKELLLDNDDLLIEMPNFLSPLAEVNNDKSEGIIIEILQLLSKNLDVNWKVVPNENAKNMILRYRGTENLESEHYTKPIISMPVVVLTANSDLVYVDDLANIDSVKAGYIKNSSFSSDLIKQYSNLNLNSYQSIYNALFAVNSGEIDILLCPLLQCSYLINEYGFNNIKIIGQTNLHEDLRISVNNELQGFIGIINKAIANIPIAKRNDIFKRWNSKQDIVVKTDYTLFWALLGVSSVVILVVLISNIKIRSYSRRLENLSYTDQLTGIKNRRYFSEIINSEIEFVKRQNERTPQEVISLGFLLIDIDHFKDVNDTYGHNSGDLFLKQFAEKLNACCRASDLVFRWGGEEFLVLAKCITDGELTLLAERIRTSVENLDFKLESETINKTCSVGVASYPFINNEIEVFNHAQVLNIADVALYSAKRSSRNAWVKLYTNAKNSRQVAYPEIIEETNRLVKEGRLLFESSITNKELKFS